jgi:ABC-type sugar transport system ATPase subunit
LNISKVFPGQTALNNVTFNVMKGEIHALLGENGAGKSTLLNILHGVFPQTAGEIYIGGQKISFTSTHDAIKFGIEKVHQEINLIPEMTVIDNLFLGNEYTCAVLLIQKNYTELETLKN